MEIHMHPACQAFVRRDYAGAAEECQRHWAQDGPWLPVAYIWLSSLERDGDSTRSRQQAPVLQGQLPNPWEKDLLASYAGLPRAGLQPDGLDQLLQSAFYQGAHFLERRDPYQARQAFNEFLRHADAPLEKPEGYLMTIESSYAETGLSGTGLDEELGQMLYEAAQCQSRGQFSEAIARVLEAQRLAPTLVGPNHPIRLLALTYLGNLHTLSGDVQTGKAYLDEAQPLALKTMRPDSPDYLALIEVIAANYWQQPELAPDRLDWILGELERVQQIRGPEHESSKVAQLQARLLKTSFAPQAAPPKRKGFWSSFFGG